jgi:hypothetical protein
VLSPDTVWFTDCPHWAVGGIMQRDLHTPRVANPGYQERRTAWRYPLQLALHYRLRKKDRLVGEGLGKTVNISNKGLLLALSGQACPRGAVAELSIHWPVEHEPSVRQWLNVVGVVLRSDEQGVAVRIARHDFSSPSADDASV